MRHLRNARGRPNHIRSADSVSPIHPVTRLPIPIDLVEPGVVQVEERITRTGHSVSHLAVDAQMSGSVDISLHVPPCRLERGRRETDVYLVLRAVLTVVIVYPSCNAVICSFVIRPKGIGAVGERSRCDAQVERWSDPAAAEAVHWIEYV